MNILNPTSSIQKSINYCSENNTVEPPSNENSESLFIIDMLDANAPAESVLETLSGEQKSWFGMLLKPYDMLHHICEKGRETLKEKYRDAIRSAICDVESVLEDTKVELEKYLTRKELGRLSELLNQPEEHSQEIHNIINTLPNISKAKAIMQVLKEGACLRTPMMLLQATLTSNIQAVPFCYSKTGMQVQIIISSGEIIKNLFCIGDKSIGKVYLQPFFHLEGGLNGMLDLDNYLDLPVNIKGAITGLRVNHFGVSIPLNLEGGNWRSGDLDYIIETVHRIEANIGVSENCVGLNIAGQAKVGMDTVRQLVFPCNSASNTAKFISQLALRALGGGALGVSALKLGVDALSVKDSVIGGVNLAGVLIDMSGWLKPDKIIDIIETVTVGLDIPVNTPLYAPQLGNLNMMLMMRLNGGVEIVHDIVEKNANDASHKELHSVHVASEASTDTQLRYRKTSSGSRVKASTTDEMNHY